MAVWVRNIHRFAALRHSTRDSRAERGVDHEWLSLAAVCDFGSQYFVFPVDQEDCSAVCIQQVSNLLCYRLKNLVEKGFDDISIAQLERLQELLELRAHLLQRVEELGL